jgi:hypothetical protein
MTSAIRLNGIPLFRNRMESVAFGAASGGYTGCSGLLRRLSFFYKLSISLWMKGGSFHDFGSLLPRSQYICYIDFFPLSLNCNARRPPDQSPS